MLQQFNEKNRDLIVNINGKLVHRDEAGVSPFDSIVQGGDGVWEGLRLYDGRIFKLTEHLDRLRFIEAVRKRAKLSLSELAELLGDLPPEQIQRIGRGEEEVHAMALGDAADWDADIEPLAARAMPWFSARHARHAEDAQPEEVEREFSPTTWTTAEISDGLELRQRGHDPRNLKRLMTLARQLRSWLEEERRAT